MSPRVKKFNGNFVENLHLDLLFLRSYISTMPLPNLADSLLELFQCLSLLLADRLEDYLDDRTRLAKYPLVKPADLIVILDKYRDSSVFSFKKNDKRKAAEVVIKALKLKTATRE